MFRNITFFKWSGTQANKGMPEILKKRQKPSNQAINLITLSFSTEKTTSLNYLRTLILKNYLKVEKISYSIDLYRHFEIWSFFPRNMTYKFELHNSIYNFLYGNVKLKLNKYSKIFCAVHSRKRH